MRFINKALTGLLFASLSLGLLVFAGYEIQTAIGERMGREPRAPQARERVFTVNVVTAQPETISPILEAFGEVQSRRTLDLRMASGGQVTMLSENFVEGGQVEQGELLVRLDDADAQSALSRATSDVVDATAEVDEAARALILAQDELDAALAQKDLRDRALARQIDLAQRGVGTAAAVEAAELAASSASQSVLSRRSAIDQAKARGANAQTRLARAQLAQQDAERRLKDAKLYAEFSGTLSQVTLVQGGLVSNNERIGSLMDPARLEVALRVSTEQYARLLDEDGSLIRANATVQLNVLGTDLESTAVLSRDSGSVAAGQTGRLLFADVQQGRGLKPGDFVTVQIQEPEMNFVKRLPATALDANNSVLVVGEGDRLEEVSVRLMRRQGDDVLVRSRDIINRDVVAQRTPVLGAGIKVKALNQAQPLELEEREMVELTEERRAKLLAAVEANTRIPKAAKDRILSQLKEDKVPAEMVQRLESRMGG